MEEFTISGINAGGTPTRVTAMTSYFTPFKINGQAANIQFALAEDIASNAIIRIPFLQSTNSSLLFEHDTMNSQKLGHAFKIYYQVPHLAEVSPLANNCLTASFPIVTPPQVIQDLNHSGTLFTNTFKASIVTSQSPIVDIVSGTLLSNIATEYIYNTCSDRDEWFTPNRDL
jgi:hypothetical protein